MTWMAEGMLSMPAQRMKQKTELPGIGAKILIMQHKILIGVVMTEEDGSDGGPSEIPISF